MTIDAGLPLLVCPVCGSALSRTDRVVGCTEGHRFDLARQGHLNLLGHQAPANADTAEMIAARARFLDSGAYEPILSAVAQAGVAHPGPVVEVGAGTGHYLRRALGDASRPHLAMDVSPAAARWCARHGLASVVADTWAGLPVRDHCVGLLLCVFAPRNPAEFARMLADDGALVVVTPTPDHLAELRAAGDLLDIPTDKTQRLDESMGSAGLVPTTRAEIAFTAQLDHQQVRDLVGMGPNAFHSPSIPTLTSTNVAVTVTTFRRSH